MALTFATNHLAPYVLLRTLAARLGDRPARFVIVGAAPRALARVPVDLDDLESRDARALGPVPGALGVFTTVLNPFVPGVDYGADNPAWLATASEVEGVTGRYFVRRKEVTTAPHTTDVARQDRLWESSARLAGLPVTR